MISNDKTVFQFRGPMGIPVHIGSSLIMLVMLFFFIFASNPITGVTLLSMLLVSIFLHELGHAWASRVQGIPVRRIMLNGGGGFCERTKSGSRKQQEFIVAMGPVVNVVLWAVAGLASQAISWSIDWTAVDIRDTGQASLMMRLDLMRLLWLFSLINGALAIFNMIPVQPMDGGKLLHLVLARFMPPARATRITGGVGVVFAVLWIPGMVLLYFTLGWILFFFPSIKLHLAMMRGNAG